MYADVVVYDDARRAFVMELKVGAKSKITDSAKQLNRYMSRMDNVAGGMVVVFGESNVYFSE